MEAVSSLLHSECVGFKILILQLQNHLLALVVYRINFPIVQTASFEVWLLTFPTFYSEFIHIKICYQILYKEKSIYCSTLDTSFLGSSSQTFLSYPSSQIQLKSTSQNVPQLHIHVLCFTLQSISGQESNLFCLYILITLMPLILELTKFLWTE